MYRHHEMSAMLAQAHERELLREAHLARMSREATGSLAAVPAHSKHQLVAVTVSLLVILGAMALI
jgi:hypothetical protein